jgi:predicted AAA+ superfamily ATPase
MARERYLELRIREDLESKMVLLAGPRQVGKTTLARRLLDDARSGVYLNWDNREDRKELRAARWPGGRGLVVLDEIHKWRPWKSWLKGEVDRHGGRLRFLVTGSARLDGSRRGGDSLQGRYHHFRLHPFSVAETAGGTPAKAPEPFQELPVPESGGSGSVAHLMARGGFPEPFLAAGDRHHRRWQKERLDRFFREDVRDLESIRDMGSLQVLADLLPERVGSPLSLNALREDLEVSHRAVTHWMDVLERLYHAYRIRPFSRTTVRTLRKMPKAYLWDWSLVPEPGPRFENLVASHLLKFCHWLEDSEGHRAELLYLRDRAGREVDFLVTVERRPWFAVEAKRRETSIDPVLRAFKEAFRVPFAYQVVLEGDRDFVEGGVRSLPAGKFLRALV